MKKTLALFVSVVMLCALVRVGASALTQEEELEAIGRAWLMQTMDDLRGDYTIERLSLDWIVHSNGRYRINCLNRESGIYEIHSDDGVLRVFPEHSAYVKLPSSGLSVLVPMLTPKEITENTPIRANNGAPFKVTYDGTEYNYYHNRTGNDYYNEKLSSIRRENRSIDLRFTGSFNKEADQSVFSVEGMREVSLSQAQEWDYNELLHAGLSTLPRWKQRHFNVNLDSVLIMLVFPVIFAFLKNIITFKSAYDQKLRSIYDDVQAEMNRIYDEKGIPT